MPRTSTIATAALGALLLTACTEPEPESTGDAPAPAETSDAPAPAETSKAPAPAETDEREETEPAGLTFDDLDGIDAAERGRGPMNEAPLPNGAFRSIEGVYEIDALLEGPTAEAPAASAANLDCASEWGSVQLQWLRAWAEQPDLGLTEDYHYGATDGPTCFGDSGGGVAEPDHRLVHHVCQSADTTARTLFSRPDGGPMAWTPEFTTENESVCFSFGEEVRAYQAEVSSAK